MGEKAYERYHEKVERKNIKLKVVKTECQE